MAEKKHEPGPWILGGASGRMITTPSGYYGDGFIADVDTLANAKLIAAAPDLLAACEIAMSSLLSTEKGYSECKMAIEKALK